MGPIKLASKIIKSGFGDVAQLVWCLLSTKPWVQSLAPHKYLASNNESIKLPSY